MSVLPCYADEDPSHCLLSPSRHESQDNLGESESEFCKKEGNLSIYLYTIGSANFGIAALGAPRYYGKVRGKL